MIGKLTGRFGGTTPEGYVLIEVGGVGYTVRTPLFGVEVAQGATGDFSLFIHTAVREDAIDLYGFPTQDELGFFKQLMSVSGIGPKTALGILNVADVTTLRRSIAAGDAAALTKVFGIGKKSAERLVVELRDKILRGVQTGPSTAVEANEGEIDVIEALMALGYSATESRTALKGISPSLTVHERIATALRNLGARASV